VLQSFKCLLIFVAFLFIIEGFIGCRLGRRELDAAVVSIGQRWEGRVICIWGAVVIGMVVDCISSWRRR